jgi:hypothetical protein
MFGSLFLKLGRFSAYLLDLALQPGYVSLEGLSFLAQPDDRFGGPSSALPQCFEIAFN